MQGEKFVEQVKRERLYDEYQGGDNVSAMLDQSPTNSRNNEGMARVGTVLDGIFGSWRGNWHNLLGDFTTVLERKYLNMEGFARVQAIEMCGAHTMSEKFVEEKKSRGGLLGLFSK